MRCVKDGCTVAAFLRDHVQIIITNYPFSGIYTTPAGDADNKCKFYKNANINAFNN